MPIQITCSCGTSLRIPDNVAGKTVKCPKCNGLVKVPGTPAPAPAAASKPAATAPAKPAGTPAAAPKKPAPAAATRPAAPGGAKPAAPAKPSAGVAAAPAVKNGPGKAAAPVGVQKAPAAPKPAAPTKPPAHVQEFLELPAHLRDRAKADLQKGETVLWAAQPSPGLLSITWWATFSLGFIFFFAGLGVIALFFLVIQLPPDVPWFVKFIVGGLGGVFMLAPLGTLYAASSERNKFLHSAYLVTNKRCIVVQRDPDGPGFVNTYQMPGLQFLFKRKSWVMGNAGHLVLYSKTSIVREWDSKGSRTVRKTELYGFLYIANLTEAEEIVHRTLIEPWLAAEERGEDPALATGQGEAPAADTAKEARKAGSDAVTARPPVPGEEGEEGEEGDAKDFVDPNEKDMPLATRQALMTWKAPEHLEDKLKEELGRGEKLVWTGKPSVLLVILNGFIFPAGALLLGLLLVIAAPICYLFGAGNYVGFMAVGASFLMLYVLFGITVQPLWRWMHAARTDYVLTNRRAIVWRPSWFGIVMKEEYRPDELEFMRRAKAWFLGQEAGSVIFRTVITRTTRTDNRGFRSSTTRTTYYGFLDIYHADAVELLINVTLLASLKHDGASYKISGGIVADYEKLKEAQANQPQTAKKERRWLILGAVGAVLAMFLVCGGASVDGWAFVDLRDNPQQANQGGGGGGGGGGDRPKENKPQPATIDSALADLKHTDHNVRERGAETLKGMKVVDSRKGQVSSELERCLRESKGPFEPGHYLEALKKWATPDCADTLLEKLADGDRGIRHPCIEILGELKVEKAVEPIAERLKVRDDRAVAEKALESIGKPAEAAVMKYVNDPDKDVKAAANKILKSLGTSGSALLPQIVEDLKSDNAATVAGAVNSLAGMKTPDPKYQAEVSAKLADLLTRSDAKIHEPAANALVVWATKDSVPAVSEALDTKNEKVRDKLWEILTRFKDERCAEKVAGHLEKAYAKDRSKASTLLIALGKPAEPAVVGVLEKTNDKDTRIAACKVLKDIGTPKSTDALKKLTSDKDKAVKAAAEEALKEASKRT